MPVDVCPTKALGGIGVSAARDSPSIDAETLPAVSYGIITGAYNSVTTVTTGARQQIRPHRLGGSRRRSASRGLLQMPRDKGSLMSTKGTPATPIVVVGSIIRSNETLSTSRVLSHEIEPPEHVTLLAAANP